MEMIKKLREKTGAKIIDCKAALDRNNGDYEAALAELIGGINENAQKKSSRETKEGVMVSYIHPNFKLGILLELLCETDFVARNQEFISLAKNLAMHFAANTDLETPRMIQPYVKDPSKTIEELINESVAKLGENIVMGRFTRYELGITPNIGKFENGNY